MSLSSSPRRPSATRHPAQATRNGVKKEPSVHIIRSNTEALEIATRVALEFKKSASDRDRERRVPLPEVELLSQSGLLAAIIPKEYGGAEISMVTLVKILQIISAVDGSLGQIHQNHFHFVNYIAAYGTHSQKEFFLGGLLAGKRLGNGLQERNARPGADPITELTAHADGTFRLNGEKYYTTGAYIAHWLPIKSSVGKGKTALVYVDRHAPGVEVINDWNAMGQRCTLSGTAIFRDVRITEQSVFRSNFEGYTPHGLTYAQILHAAIDTGIAQGALEETAHFTTEHARPANGAQVEKAGQDPHLIKQFGELVVEFQASEALLLRAAALLDASLADEANETAGLEANLAVAAARVQADRAALRVSSQLFEFGGTRSTDEKWNLNRYWRDARTHTLHDPIRWKLHHLGNYYLNGIKPPTRGGPKPAAGPS